MLNASLFEQLPDVSSVAVAVSGGADSFALLHLAQEWAKSETKNLVALTVDHGLRAQSLTEAQAVASWCKENATAHHILSWDGEKPCTGLQEAARNARRHLLCQFCQDNNIPVLLMAHQADDQAETMLMRLQRGSGLHGLTCIPQRTTDRATRTQIIRPLLEIRRQDLRAYCVAQGLPFIDDPSNANCDFERVRIRNLLKELPEFADGVTKSVARLRQADNELNTRAEQWHDTYCRQIAADQTWLPKQDFNTQSQSLRVRILSRFFDGDYLKLARLENIVLALQGDDFAGQTLDGLWLRPKIMDKTKGWIIQPAPARKAG